ncbi:unnamed protein product [Lactuca virosa]|uniref:Protein kinase domain-containing protein n=1 Tax=Lactuca virosa TaxID=75947 RepID=A0AAU9PEM0_9ASTR|nr:unnamed protein product [Lactuca virosa]
MVAGCNISASFKLLGPFYRSVGCTSNCYTNAINRSITCNGSNGCCQTNIPIEVGAYQSYIFHFGSEAPCSHTFIAEKDYFPPTLSRTTETTYHFPVALNWVITLASCHQTLQRGNYLCGQNSRCIDSTKGRGYNCRCMKGYSGNPYLPNGCQDINECRNQSNYPYREDQICINTPGSYKCTSSHGHISIISELRRRKENKIKQEFFKRNGGYLLKQRISANKSHVMKIKIYSANVIAKATDGFSQSRLLGKGGQGTVYKGFLTDGTIVAIKRSNVVDEDEVERFVNEVFILAQINHRNIVKLLGCCLE